VAAMTRVEQVLKALGIKYAQQGDEFSAHCPYHDDLNPSWAIKWKGDKSGLHHCFSCSSGGTLNDLVVHCRRIHYIEAKRWIESVAGSEETGPARAPIVVLRSPDLGGKGFRLPLEVCCEELLGDWPTPPREYARARGVTAIQASRWGVGYAVVGRLQGRLVLVVRNRLAQPRSYMARDYLGEGKRYLYPRTEERPDLDVVFGEQHWPPSGRDRVVVTEGALDALAAERAGAQYVAAIGGSQVRPMHVTKISTFREAVVMTDPDEAGENAAENLRAMLGRSVSVVRVKLATGRDANATPEGELREILRGAA